MATRPTHSTGAIPPGLEAAMSFGLLDAIGHRRSRRFGLGMEIPDGVMQHSSRFPPVALTELEEAFLVWAGTGLTGLSLGDLPRAGVSWMYGWAGRSWPCSCNSHSTELFYTNDAGVHVVKLADLMPEDGETSVIGDRSAEEKLERMLGLFRGARRTLDDHRAPLPPGEPGLFDFNAWNTNRPGTSFFVPVTNTTLEYMILLFIYFGPRYGFNVVDELNGGRSCGLDRWIEKGLIRDEVRLSLFDLEMRVLTSLNVEQAFICQNMALALQALGLGGWAFTGLLPHYVLGVDPAYPGLGFRFTTPEHSVRNVRPPVPVGRDGVFEALCPPYVPDMREAVDRFLEMREGYWAPDQPMPQRDPAGVRADDRRPTPDEVEMVKDLCQYVHETYGRFPAFIDPMFVRLVFQAHHLDLEFYDRHYTEGAYGEIHRRHFELWHPEHDVLVDHREPPDG